MIAGNEMDNTLNDVGWPTKKEIVLRSPDC